MATYFIVGASRGIGFELVQQTLKQYPNSKVIAGARKPFEVPSLVELHKTYPSRLSLVTIDQSSSSSVQEAAKEITRTHLEGIDYLVLNAAIVGQNDKELVEDVLSVFDVNVAGPLRVIQEFLPLVKKSQKKVVVAISSLVGNVSFQDFLLDFYHNNFGTKDPILYGYRISKGALNLLTIMLAKDHQKEGVIFIPVHPGVVETDMFFSSGGSKVDGVQVISPVESATKQLELYHKLTLEDSGKYFTYSGEVVQLA